MIFTITKEDGNIEKETIISIGGGTIVTKDNAYDFVGHEIYPEHNLKEVILFCKKNHISLEDYVIMREGETILPYLDNVYQTMENARLRGISASGLLPGSLKVERKAREMFMNMRKAKDGKTNIHMNVAIASFAVAEENASGGLIVIAPTCGSAGVIPGAITYLKMKSYTREQIVRGLLVAGLIGIISKTNASISGAECGCQAEIGVACAMAAAMLADVQDIGIDNVAQAAEIAMEHSLGLTCDPIDGYVQIPCIERCAIFALKAINAATLAKLIPAYGAKVSFDQSLATMYSTGLDLKEGYRETSLSGLAKLVK
jgi:L-serine dehydratase